MIPKGDSQRGLWMASLRWWAAGTVVLGSVFARHVLGLPVPVLPLMAVGILVAAYNYLVIRSLKLGQRADRTNLVQMVLDLICLTVVVLLTGGVESPLLVYFVFHLVIAGITLPVRTAYALAGGVIAGISSGAALSYYGFLPHVYLWGHYVTLHMNPAFVLAVITAWGSTVFLLTYMATSLKGELDFRHRQVVKANRKLREKDLMKSRYVLAVAHDLKSPLTSVCTSLQVAMSGRAGEMSEDLESLLSRAEDNCEMVLKLIDDLLLLSRIRTEEAMRPEQVSPRLMMKELERSLGEMAEEQGVSFTWRCPVKIPSVAIGERALDHVIRNLVENAIRYTPPGGEVEVSFRHHQEGVIMAVRDTGIGISQKELARVFEEFYRGSGARHRVPQGTGLGLTIVNELVTRAGGRVTVNSEEGKGTEVAVQLRKVVAE